MAKFISNDLLIYISSAAPTTVELKDGANPITAFTASTNGVATLTVASTTGIKTGDAIGFTSTGITTLDDKLFVVGAVVVDTSLEIVGATITAADVTATTPMPTAAVATITSVDSLTKVCLREMEIGQATTSEVDASTFCNEATLPGPSTPGSVTMTGYVDTTSDAYLVLKAAADDGVERFVKFVGPSSQYWVGKITFGDLSWSFPRGDVVTFTATGTQSQKLEHVF